MSQDPSARRTLAHVGEFGLIEQLIGRIPSATDLGRRVPGVLVGAGDDCAVLAVPTGPLVVTVDMLVEGRDFRRDWSTAEQVGGKAMAASLADVAATGARPWVCVVAFGGPADLEADWALACMSGLTAQAAGAGAAVVGGDVSSAAQIVVSVTAIGDLEGRIAVLRSGARAGDVVAVAGRLGWSAAGLAVLEGGGDRQGVSAELRQALAAVVDDHCLPCPPYAHGPQAADGGATAMIDISDGLLADAEHLAVASGVDIHLASAAMVPDGPVLMAGRLIAGRLMAGRLMTGGTDRRAEDLARTWVLTGGEDHALLATFPGPDVPAGFRVIGHVAHADERPGRVWLDGVPHRGAGGFQHFAPAESRREG